MLWQWIIIFIWDVFVIGGTAYLVGWQGWSPWWFALALCLLASPGKDD